MKVLILLFLFIGFYLMFHELRTLEKLNAVLKRTRVEMDAASRQRTLADRQKLLSLQERNSLWLTLEQCLQYSGIRSRMPGMTPERFAVVQVLASIGIFLAVLCLFGWKASFAAVGMIWLSEWAVVKVLREKNLRRTENNLAKLLDFLGNYSIVSGDVTGVLGQISKYMDEPVRGALEGCYHDASTTGDATGALLSMAERVEHPKFKELARNMEISVRYCADFSALVNSSRRSLRDYLHMARERKNMKREALIELFLLLMMSAVLLIVVSRLTGIRLLVFRKG